MSILHTHTHTRQQKKKDTARLNIAISLPSVMLCCFKDLHFDYRTFFSPSFHILNYYASQFDLQIDSEKFRWIKFKVRLCGHFWQRCPIHCIEAQSEKQFHQIKS